MTGSPEVGASDYEVSLGGPMVLPHGRNTYCPESIVSRDRNASDRAVIAR